MLLWRINKEPTTLFPSQNQKITPFKNWISISMSVELNSLKGSKLTLKTKLCWKAPRVASSTLLTLKTARNCITTEKYRKNLINPNKRKTKLRYNLDKCQMFKQNQVILPAITKRMVNNKEKGPVTDKRDKFNQGKVQTKTKLNLWSNNGFFDSI